jgi:hypothetical protein
VNQVISFAGLIKSALADQSKAYRLNGRRNGNLFLCM